ncbi:MAG: carboxypeptidase regulatory-like domain-containing protein [Planctomycetes bacterium]|nr:carboxypeptidase regulatory-like domain-containing protein [Planctomycetota bacterium]
MRSRFLVIALVLIVAAAIGWWWKSARVGADVAAPSIAPMSTSNTPESPRLDAFNPPEAPVVETRTEAAPQIATTPTVATPSTLGPKEAWIEVEVVAKEDGHALPRVRIYAEPIHRAQLTQKPVDASEGSEKEAPRTGDDGRARLRVRSGIDFDIAATWEQPPMGYGTGFVAALEPGATHSLRIEIPTLPDLPFFGRVVSRADGSPIAGATIAREERWVSYDSTDDAVVVAPLEFSAGVRSASDGSFRLDGDTWRESALRIDAQGFGREIEPLGPGHETADRAQVIELAPAGVLRIVVLGELPASNESLRVEVTNRDRVVLALGNGAFSSGELRWSAEVGADRAATLADLPSHKDLRIVLVSDGHVLLRHADAVRLEPGEVRNLELELGVGAVIAGSLRDEKRAPVADAWIWLVSFEYAERAFGSWDEPVQRTQTNAAGRFELAEVRVGDWLVGAAPAGERSESDSNAGFASLARKVEIDARDRRVEVDLEVTRSLSIAGRVVDARGRGIAGRMVTAEGAGGHESRVSRGDDGAFEFAPVAPGKWQLRCSGGKGWADTEWIDVEAGTRDVVITLERGGSLRVTTLDEAGDPVRDGALETWQPREDSEVSTATRWSLDGTERTWTNLRAGIWDVIATTPDGRIGAERVNVVAGDQATTLVLRVRPGGTLLIRARTSKYPIPFVVEAAGVRIARSWFRLGDAEPLVVPAGALRVSWRSPKTNELESREVHLDVGQRLELDLEDG